MKPNHPTLFLPDDPPPTWCIIPVIVFLGIMAVCTFLILWALISAAKL